MKIFVGNFNTNEYIAIGNIAIICLAMKINFKVMNTNHNAGFVDLHYF